MRKIILAVLLFLSLPGVAVAAPATPLVVPTLATLQSYTALTMSLNPNIYLTGTTAGSTTGAAHYSWEATYVGSPDGTLVIAPSDHPGTCASGCMVRATPAAVAGGSNTQVQYNNAGAIGGISGATSNGTSLTVSSGNLKLSGSSSGTSTFNAPATGGGTATLFPGTDTVTGNDAVQTLTNKSISGSANMLTNIGNSSLVNSSTTVNGQTCTLGYTCTVTAAASGVTVGTTTVSSGTSGRVLYDNSGVLGELVNTGSGNNVLATAPSISSPVISGGTIDNATVGATTATTGKFTTLQATGSLTTNVTGSTQCLQANSSGVVSGVGSACSATGASYTNTAGFAPTMTSSAALVMMGIGSSVTITPSKSGTVQVLISGYVSNGGSAVDVPVNAAYGTGSAPASGDPATGTLVQTRNAVGTSTANSKAGFSITARVSGLTIGTPYWFDAEMGSNGVNNSTMIVTSVTLFEP